MDDTPDQLVPFDAWPPSGWLEFAASAPPAPAPPPEASTVAPGIGVPSDALDAAQGQLPPPPPPEVDAISGAASPPIESYVGEVHTEAPQLELGPNVADPAYLDQTAQHAQGAALPSLVDQELEDTSDAKAQFYAQDPQALAHDTVVAEGAKRSQAIAETARLQKQDAEQAVADHLRHQATIATIQQESQQIIADSTKLANTKIDPNLHPGVFGAIGNVIALTLGGAMSQYTGGRNLALEQLNKAIDNHIDAQKSDIANQWRGIATRREGVADQQAQEADQQREDATFRVGVLGRAMNDLQTRMQDFDPRGTQTRELAGQYQQISGAQQKALMDFQQKRFDNVNTFEKTRQAQQVIDETRRKNMADEAAKAAKAAGGAGSGKRGVPLPPQAWYAKNKITTDGPLARAAYADYAAGFQGAGSSSAGGGSSAAGRSPAAAAPAAAGQGKTETPAYASDDDWIETHAPATSDAEKQLYYFVDNNHGNEAPPIKFSNSDDAKGFRERYRIRQQMAEKADQVIHLVRKLRGDQSTWERIKRAGPRWFNINDADVQELKSVHQSLALDAIKANGMGVPTGKDVEMGANMVGGDPSGWQNIEPQLQRARGTIELEANRDWQTYAGPASKDPAYAKYRAPAKADPAWIAKLQHRGEVKILGPEYGNTDPKQLKAVESKADAPNVERAGAQTARKRNLEAASKYLQASGYEPDPGIELSEAADLGLVNANETRVLPTPQVEDFPFKGPPEHADEFAKLRTYHVNNVAVLNRYIASHKPEDWAAYQKGQELEVKSLGQIGRVPLRVSRAEIGSWTKDPAVIGRITTEVLREGGK